MAVDQGNVSKILSVLSHPLRREILLDLSDNGESSFTDLLNLLKEDSLLPPDLKRVVEHLTVRVTEEFKLPVDADLVAEAHTLCDELLKQISP